MIPELDASEFWSCAERVQLHSDWRHAEIGGYVGVP